MTDGAFRNSEPKALLPLLEAARDFARQAGEVTLRHFGAALEAESKDDGTPVTRADREAETVLREAIRSRFPEHAILGEEFGEEGEDTGVRWILDPIDGTRSFMRGVPLYAVLVGVEVHGRAAIGVAHFPALDETVAAGVGVGCRWTRSGKEVAAKVSTVSDLGRAVVLTTDPPAAAASHVGNGWKALTSQAAFTRSWGDAYGHILVATGRAEAMMDPVLAAWDAAPLLPILEEAGGRFTTLAGEATIHGGSGVSTNGRLHAPVLDLLSHTE